MEHNNCGTGKFIISFIDFPHISTLRHFTLQFCRLGIITYHSRALFVYQSRGSGKKFKGGNS